MTTAYPAPKTERPACTTSPFPTWGYEVTRLGHFKGIRVTPAKPVGRDQATDSRWRMA
jgi:hypothetical protein